MFVKPRNGLRVLRPDSRRPLPAEGAEVADDFYWNRRIAHGDVEVAEPPEAEPEPPAEEKPAAEHEE
jgi:hypothetical protein